MNVRFGNLFLVFLFCVSILLLALTAVSLFYIFSTADEIDDFSLFGKQSPQPFNSQYRNTYRSLFWCLSSICILDLLVITSFGLRKLYRRTQSLEIFFFILFLYAFCFESFRAGAAISLVRNTPVYVGIAFSRTVYFGRLIGLLSMLFSSLYALPMKYPKYPILLLTSILVSLTIAASTPVDSTVLLSTVMYKLGEEHGMLFVTYSIGILSILNHLYAALHRRNVRFVATAVTVLMLLAGREIISNTVEPYAIAAGLLLIFFGKLFFSKQMARILIWYDSFTVTHGQ